MQTDDTIVAVSTPAGRGGIGVVRLSGAAAVCIAQTALRPPAPPAEQLETPAASSGPDAAKGRSTTGTRERILQLAPWRVAYAELADEQGALIDRVLASFFRKPHSYTAEDVVEISCHGSPVVLEFLVRRCLQAGARLAEPGEFTMRAFLNGRMDLTQAEAVRDLIEAQTLYQAKVAAGQVEGAVSHRLTPIKKQLVQLIAELEAGIDFAEDDVSVLPSADISARLGAVQDGLRSLALSFSTGKLIHRGLTLAIVGRPNVGKSSLFNCLLEQDRAIVTANPGTTRDLVAETVELDGIPLRFLDTAGIRRAFDEAESIGVRKSYEAAADSDLAVLVLDGAQPLLPEDRDLLARLRPLGKLLVAVNKSDLPQRLSCEALRQEMERLPVPATGVEPGRTTTTRIVAVSALTRSGMEDLRQAILHTALPALAGDRESQFLTSLRQEKLVCESLLALEAAAGTLEAGLPHEMLLVDLYSALQPLDAITGETTVEDILTNIFSTFCIGK